MLSRRTLDALRQQLLALRDDLEARASDLRSAVWTSTGGRSLGADANLPVPSGDLGNQEAEIVVNVGLAENATFMRQEIDAALLRLEDKTYGVCEECHKEINVKRLRAVPYARRCIHCANQLEQG